MNRLYHLRSILNIFSRRPCAVTPLSRLCNQPPWKVRFLSKLPQVAPWRPIAFGISILGWLGFETEDENKENPLITTLKRAVLCTQREQFDTAEQMLHVALRLAQQQQNRQGILYCYDLMANLAFDTFQLAKAEKLFITVMQMLLESGVDDKDLKIIHISLKVARIAQLTADLERADIGYKWCLEQIVPQKDNNEDATMLYGIINDWYAQYLLDTGQVDKALIHLKEAYQTVKMTQGTKSEQSMLLLNDLGTTSFRAGDIPSAQKFLQDAIKIGHQIEDKNHLGVVHANLGLILLENGVTNEAEKYCKEAWKLGKRHENNESMEQANYCLDQIKLVLQK